MKFAEMTQEVHITRSNPIKLDLGFTPVLARIIF